MLDITPEELFASAIVVLSTNVYPDKTFEEIINILIEFTRECKERRE